MIWLTVIVFILMLLALVLVHEFGHFIAAKKAGCNVEEFAFGFPPRLWSFTKNGTRYSFNLLPIGGYVKIEGEDMEEENPGPGSFASKSVYWRLAILAAGVTMNIVLAVFLLTWQAAVGVPTLVTDENQNNLTDIKTFITQVDQGSPAEQIGLQQFDRVVSVNGVTDPNIEQVQKIVNDNQGEKISLEVERRGQHLEQTITPRINAPPNEGPMGVALQMTGLEKAPLWQAPWAGLKRTGQALWLIVAEFSSILQRLIVQQEVSESIAGPVGIAVYTNEMTNMGLSYILEFAAFISINLAIINILPIPALDGGRIIFALTEAITRRRVPKKVEQISHMTGFALLILLMLLVTFKDIGRFF